MRFHIPAIPHTVTNYEYLSCAYTQKVLKLCAMLKKLGHEVYHYGCEGSLPDSTENVMVITEAERKKYYPTDFHTQQFRFDPGDALHQKFYANCIREIKLRQKPKDFLLCAWGFGHKPIADEFGSEMVVVESGIGYESVFSDFRVFESYTWMSHVYGIMNVKNGAFYDSVIPNYFDPNDFLFSAEKEDWFLYLGRIVHRKGIDIAVQVTKEIGAKLVIAGQGTLQNTTEGINIKDSHVEHVGFADIEKRKMLLSKAKGVFMPTYYIEPFGGVSIEAAMSGTPVISTDWGVFSENILHGTTGFRCRTFDQFSWAAENVHTISPHACREWAIANYSMDRVSLMYQEYFEMLYDLWDKGWYTRKNSKSGMDWLKKYYPTQVVNKPIQPPIENITLINSGSKSGNKPKIAIWSQLKWAFGRIAGNIKRLFEDEYEVQLFSWGEIYLPGTFDQFDLIYVPTWDTRRDFLTYYPSIPSEKVICVIHGAAELFNKKLKIQPGEYGKISIQTQTIDEFNVSDELVEHLSTIPAIGVVNKRLLQQIKLATGLENLFLTECGVDTKQFEPVLSTRSSLQVAYPIILPADYDETHGYDVKRFSLVRSIKENLEKDLPGVYFNIPGEYLPNRKMAKWYPAFDVHLCLSHSEGGPLVALESAACGLVQLSTQVGIVPDIVKHNVDGFLLRQQRDNEMYEEICHYLSILQNDRDLLVDMKLRTRKTIEANWTWFAKKEQWKQLFESALNKNISKTSGLEVDVV